MNGMELPEATPLIVPDHFRRGAKALAQDFGELRLALQEPAPHRQVTDMTDPVTHENTTPKGRVKHYMAHTLSGLLTLAESTPENPPIYRTACDILAMRQLTEDAIRDAKFEFGGNTLPRDQLGRLESSLTDLYRDMEAMMTQASRAAHEAANKRLGQRDAGRDGGWAKE